MPEVLLGIGSNIDRENNIQLGLQALSNFLTDIRLSPVYESAAVGFSGDHFLNFVLLAYTELPLKVLADKLRQVEFQLGREKNAVKFSSRHLDIDILTYGALVGDFNGVVLPRAEILENDFVLFPLADLVPDTIHAVCGKAYADIRREKPAGDQILWKSSFIPQIKNS